jgi:hypothetical protein
MCSIGRPNDIVVVSSIYGHDDPWSRRSFDTLRSRVLESLEDPLEREMTNTMFDLMDRKTLLYLSDLKSNEEFKLALVEYLETTLSSADAVCQSHWEKLCIRYCREQGISHQLWHQVLNQWVIKFSDTFVEHHRQDPRLIATPDIDWEHAIQQGKLIYCFEPCLEKDPSVIDPYVALPLVQYAAETKRLGAQGHLFSIGLNAGFELPKVVAERIQDSDFTWVSCTREPSDMRALLRPCKSNKSVFNRLLIHRTSTSNPAEAIEFLNDSQVDPDHIKKMRFFCEGYPGHFILIENNEVISLKMSIVSFMNTDSVPALKAQLVNL